MQIKKKISNAVAKISLAMAKKSCGAASSYGSYQPKEPANLKKVCK